MKERVEALLAAGVEALKSKQIIPTELSPKIQVEPTRDPAHGDWATNLALMLAKPAGMPPRQLAEALVEALETDDSITGIDVAGPGFINFRLAQGAAFAPVIAALKAGDDFGRGEAKNDRVQVEFVSANPTGPLHVGHGRGAAFGASLSSVLSFAGHGVEREYYVNDAGRQMHILAASVWLRYLQKAGVEMPFPANAYQGDYISDIAAEVENDRYVVALDDLTRDLPKDAPEGDKEIYIDAVIARGKELLGEDGWEVFRLAALNGILAGIRDDLADFRVTFDNWFSEKSLMDTGAVQASLDALTQAGHTYTEKGALWFRSTAFGDDKDRVLSRDNGETTYFASDVAYIANKLQRGYDHIVYVFGADHHGYIARMRAACEALGHNPQKLEFKLVQFVSLYQGGEKAQMSTRSGEFVTLEDLRNEVGNDAARIFYASRKVDVPMDFDLDLATKQSKDNPVYYIQYAHARVHAIGRKLNESGATLSYSDGFDHLGSLESESEKELAKAIGKFPELIQRAAQERAPHTLVHYLQDLAAQFHGFYNTSPIMDAPDAVKRARFTLAGAVAQVLKTGLNLLGASAPEKM